MSQHVASAQQSVKNETIQACTTGITVANELSKVNAIILHGCGGQKKWASLICLLKKIRKIGTMPVRAT